MFEAITAHPAGESTVARMALTAADYGYDGIVVRNSGDEPASYDAIAIATEYDIDVVEGVEITAGDRSQASGFLGNHRAERTVVAVRGGTNELNRFAVEQPAVDVLANPFGLASAGETENEGATADVDHVLAKTAAENGVRLEVSLGPVLRDTGGSRVRAIQALRKLRRLVEQYETPYVVTGSASSHLGLRSPRELQAVGDVLGFSGEQIEAGLEAWRQLTERNRERHSDAFVEPGVRRDDE